MPNLKVSKMSAATVLNAADYFMVIQGGVNKSITSSVLLNNLNSTNSIRVNPLQHSINITLSSTTDANALVVDGASDRIGIGTATPASKLHVNGNIQAGSATTDGVISGSSEAVSYTAADQVSLLVKPISPLRSVSVVNLDAGVNGTFSLSNGFNGQIKTIVQGTIDAGGAKSSVVSFTGYDFNTVTLTHVGETAVLQYVSAISKWVIVSSHGATFSLI